MSVYTCGKNKSKSEIVNGWKGYLNSNRLSEAYFFLIHSIMYIIYSKLEALQTQSCSIRFSYQYNTTVAHLTKI